MASTNKTKHFRFLELPPELRLIIYTYYLDTFTLPRTEPVPMTEPSLFCNEEVVLNRQYVAPLLNTCQLVRTEAAKLYYERLKEVVLEARATADEMRRKAKGYSNRSVEHLVCDCKGCKDSKDSQAAAAQARFERACVQNAARREVEMMRRDGIELRKIKMY